MTRMVVTAKALNFGLNPGRAMSARRVTVSPDRQHQTDVARPLALSSVIDYPLSITADLCRVHLPYCVLLTAHPGRPVGGHLNTENVAAVRDF